MADRLQSFARRLPGMDFRTRLRIFGPVWVMPPLVGGALVLAVETGGTFESLYVERMLPWLLTAWIGAGFTSAWETLRESARLQGTPPLVVAATAVLSALFILSQLGGVPVLWEDPWIFGAAIWPGIRLAGPLVFGATGIRRPRAGNVSHPTEARVNNDGKTGS